MNLEYEFFEEIQTVTFAGYVSQIGGQLSLFLGGSLVSIVQICVVVVLCASRKCIRRKAGAMKCDQPQETATESDRM